MHIEGDFLGVGSPALVAEAVDVFTIVQGSESVVVGGNRMFEVLTVS